MLSLRRTFLLAVFLVCAASCALAYPISYTINVTFSDIAGQPDPLGLGTQSPPAMATITTTLESVTPPGAGTYDATITLTALGKTLPNTGTITITTGGVITANFSGSSGSFTANLVLPGVTFPYPAPLAFGTVDVSAPASTVTYDVFGASGTVGITGSVVATGLSASPTSISASYSGGSAPAPQTITVNDSTGAEGFTASVGTGSNGSSTSFLLVTPASGTTPAPVTLTFSPSVAPGTYTADVLLNTSADTSGAPLSIPVTYTVSASTTPQLQLSGIAPFTFYTPSSTTSGTAQLSVAVSSGSSNGTFTASVTSGSSFLSISPTTGTTPATLTVTVNATGLAVGSYSGAIAVSVPGFPTATAYVTVSVISTSSSGGGGGTTSGITLSPAALTFNVATGSSTPTAATVQISTPTPVSFTVSGNEYYLPITPLSGTTNATITIGVNASALLNGSYGDNITITAGGLTATLPVTVNVGSVTDISLTTYAVYLTSPGTLSQTIPITSDTATEFMYTLTPSASWITVTPSTGTSPGSFTITANPTGLPAGISTGTVTITAPGVRNSPQVVQVSLNVAQASAPALTAAPSVILFTAAPGGAAPTSQTVQLTPTAATAAYTVTAIGSPWLTASLNATTGAVTLTADPTGLVAGTYPGSIEVSSTGITNSPYYLPVTLVVSTTAAFAAEPPALNFGGTAGGPSPAPQTVALVFGTTYTTGPSPATWLSLAFNSSGLVATVDTTGLAAGSYSATVMVSATSGATQQTISIPVTLTVGSPATPVISAVTSAISYVTTEPGAPGDLMAVFGTNLTSGTSGGNTLQTATNTFGTVLSGVEVFADGIPCPMLYASAGQVNVILPFALAGQTSADIYLNAYGVTSNTLTIPIQATSPALFSSGANGTGPGAILNPDLTFNSSTNPAPAGSEVALFGGGAGVTSPFAADGQIIPTATPFPTLAATVTATVAGQPATVDYSGDAPGLVAGVLQVNITIPAGTPSGAQPVVISVGGVNSQTGITVYVQ
jgi:uncharacterized protein (TIGR03437 family)